MGLRDDVGHRFAQPNLHLILHPLEKSNPLGALTILIAEAERVLLIKY